MVGICPRDDEQRGKIFLSKILRACLAAKLVMLPIKTIVGKIIKFSTFNYYQWLFEIFLNAAKSAIREINEHKKIFII